MEREAEFPTPINVLCCQDTGWHSFQLTAGDGTAWAWVMPGRAGTEGTREAPWEGNSLHPRIGF